MACKIWSIYSHFHNSLNYFLLLLVFILMVKCSDDYYTSPYGIQKLIKVEQTLLTAAFEYVSALEGRINKVKRYLEDYEQSVVAGMKIPGHKIVEGDDNIVGGNDNKLRIYSGEKDLKELATKVSSHPLMTYRMMRRFAYELQEIEKDISLNNEKKFLMEMEKARKGLKFPTTNDITGAMEGIIRLQDAYNLDMIEFTTGNFLGLQTNSKLRAVDCYQIGIYALKASIFTRALEWLERAFFMAKEESDASISVQLVEKAFLHAIEQHNKKKEMDPSNMYVFKTRFLMTNSSAQAKERPKPERTLEDISHELYREKETVMDLWNFAALCAGKILQPLNQSKELSCFYRSWSTIPIYKEKIELLHQDPPIYQIYDVLSDAEIERALERAAPFMSRSKVLGKSEKELFIQSSIRTSTTHWIHESSDEILSKIPFRVQMITGLDVLGSEASEDLQISSYGIGGHYNPHFDTLRDGKPLSAYENSAGDRIATFMFYLSSVQRGGGTAFPRLGVVTRPLKGSAVYWHNLKQDGSRHPFSLHGGCPVIYGTKHVANKWIRSNSQMFRHKCTVENRNRR